MDNEVEDAGVRNMEWPDEYSIGCKLDRKLQTFRKLLNSVAYG